VYFSQFVTGIVLDIKNNLLANDGNVFLTLVFIQPLIAWFYFHVFSVGKLCRTFIMSMPNGAMQWGACKQVTFMTLVLLRKLLKGRVSP
jgi:hypothetical protein